MTPVRGCAFSAGSKSRRKPASTYCTRGAFPARKAPLVQEVSGSGHTDNSGNITSPVIPNPRPRLEYLQPLFGKQQGRPGRECVWATLFPSMLSLLTYMDIIRLDGMMCSPGR